jgi:hypothetical protein
VESWAGAPTDDTSLKLLASFRKKMNDPNETMRDQDMIAEHSSLSPRQVPMYSKKEMETLRMN